MGFSLIGAAAIIGIAIFMAIEILTGSLLPTITGVNDSYDELKERMIDQIHTDINITNVATVVNGSNYDYNISIKNTGSITLKTTDFTILINGTKQPFSCSQTYLHPTNIVYFTVPNVQGSGTQRVKVVTDNGINEYYEHIIS